jgi:N-acetylmuramoyl-L-alanine amidase
LTGANMPAVLSEISFVSNASDESLLFETAQRHRMPGTALRAKRKLLGENHVLASPRFQ